MNEDARHLARMAAAQHVFCVNPTVKPKLQDNSGKALSLPIVIPNDAILDKFWGRVAELTARYHNANDHWLGSDEVRQWNRANRTVSNGFRRNLKHRHLNPIFRPVTNASIAKQVDYAS